MMKYLLLAIGIASPTGATDAASYFCGADAGAIVEDGANRPASSAIANVSDSKYVVTFLDGRWIVKPLGQEILIFDQCVTGDDGAPSFCEVGGEMFGGSFIMERDGRFSILWLTRANDRDRWVVAKGRCSRVG